MAVQKPLAVVVDSSLAQKAVSDAARELLINYTAWLSEDEHETHAVQGAAGIPSRQARLVDYYLEEAKNRG